MKVFVRSNELTQGGKPTVLAFYPDDSNIPNNAHGEGMTVLMLPDNAIKRGTSGSARRGGGRPELVDNWRDLSGTVISTADQLANLYGLFNTMMKYGTDISHWPKEAVELKHKVDEQWKLVQQKK